jgi:hypothetical protein
MTRREFDQLLVRRDDLVLALHLAEAALRQLGGRASRAIQECMNLSSELRLVQGQVDAALAAERG